MFRSFRKTFPHSEHHKGVKARGALSVSAMVVLAAALQAEPVFEAPGVPNFHQVNDHVFRGAQPHPTGFANLAKLGIKTVIDLRGVEHERTEEKLVNAAGMHYIHVPLDGFAAPTEAQIATLLELLDDSSGWPVFIHCRRGADRTGTVVACYRIAHDHWDNQKALTEAKLCRMSSLEGAMQIYILQFKAPPAAAPKPVLSVVQPGL
jgi:tyrosine-protein phosphatase SIW14